MPPPDGEFGKDPHSESRAVGAIVGAAAEGPSGGPVNGAAVQQMPVPPAFAAFAAMMQSIMLQMPHVSPPAPPPTPGLATSSSPAVASSSPAVAATAGALGGMRAGGGGGGGGKGAESIASHEGERKGAADTLGMSAVEWAQVMSDMHLTVSPQQPTQENNAAAVAAVAAGGQASGQASMHHSLRLPVPERNTTSPPGLASPSHPAAACPSGGLGGEGGAGGEEKEKEKKRKSARQRCSCEGQVSSARWCGWGGCGWGGCGWGGGGGDSESEGSVASHGWLLDCSCARSRQDLQGGAAASARRSEPRREQRQRQRVACAHAALRHSDRRWWALNLLALLVLYWYKSTNTHAKGAAAGFAGLAAADELHALGCKVVVLEARERIGGRCWTDDSLDGRIVDLGAAWIHGIIGNPIAELARSVSADLYHIPSDMLMHDADGKPVDSETDLNVERVFNEMLESVRTAMSAEANAHPHQDYSLGLVLQEMASRNRLFDSVRNRQLFSWHCANIEYSTATDINTLSAKNWSQDDENAFDGEHCLVKKGYRVLAESLAAGLDIRLGAHVLEIEYAGVGKEACKVHIQTRASANSPASQDEDARGGPSGQSTTTTSTLSSDLLLVTLPLGVLKSGDVAFSPPLPKWKQEAIKKVGFGTLNKLVLAFHSNFWKAATPKGKYIGYASKQKGEYYMFIDISSSTAQPTLVVIVSGTQALEMEQKQDEEIVAGALRVLALILGEHAVQVPTGYKITRWGQDAYARGSYSYVSVGSTPLDMDALARPLDGGRVFFAGEHTNSEYPASVHGAFISGRREARQMLRRWHDLALPDEIAYGMQVSADQNVCALCGRAHEDGPEGHLIGPFKLAGKGNTCVLVHDQCAQFSPEVSKEGPHWYNVCKAIRRGRRSKCSACQQVGATIGCYVETCKQNMHWRCASESAWDFKNPEQGRNFFCKKHRKNADWQAVPTGKRRNEWPHVDPPPSHDDPLDLQQQQQRADKRRKLLANLVAPSGLPVWVDCRPLSLVGLPVAALRGIAADAAASALAPANVLQSLEPAPYPAPPPPPCPHPPPAPLQSVPASLGSSSELSAAGVAAGHLLPAGVTAGRLLPAAPAPQAPADVEMKSCELSAQAVTLAALTPAAVERDLLMRDASALPHQQPAHAMPLPVSETERASAEISAAAAQVQMP